MAAETDIEWAKRVQLKIAELLRPIIKDDETFIRFLNQDAMRVWVRAFTHETWNLLLNYEELEFLGDAVLKYIFPAYLMRTFPNLDKEDLTNLNNYYMSKTVQPKWAIILGLNKLVRVKGLDISNWYINTDIFESFFGALVTIGNSIAPFFGVCIAGYVLEYYLDLSKNKEFQISLEHRSGPPKSVVLQIFSRVQLDKLNVSKSENSKGVWAYRVSLTKPQNDFLRGKNFFLDQTSWSGSDPVDKKAEEKAYINAQTYLNSKGITTEQAIEWKREIEMEPLKAELEQAMRKGEKNNILGFEFKQSRKAKVEGQGATIQLIAIINRDSKLRKEIVATKFIDTYQEDALKQGRKELLEEFINAN